MRVSPSEMGDRFKIKSCSKIRNKAGQETMLVQMEVELYHLSRSCHCCGAWDLVEDSLE